MLVRAWLILLLTVGFVAANEPAPIGAPYNKVFDPWRACTAAESLAQGGAPDALRTLFLAAYVRVNQPFPGGEDLEAMSIVFDEVLSTLGDAKFARALALQRPEVRSATRWFLAAAATKEYPRTAKLLRSAPEIDWPLAKAYRDDR